MRWSLFIFLLISMVIFGLAHRYAYVRLFGDTRLPRAIVRLGKVLLTLLWLSVPFGMALRRTTSPVGGLVAAGIFLWVGIALVLTTTLGLLDLVRWVLFRVKRGSGASAVHAPGHAPVDDPSRRRFLARSLAGAAVIATTGQTGLGMAAALGDVDVVEVPVKLPRLPATLSGLVIVQITDLHVHAMTKLRAVEHLSERIAALKPDLFCITGDLVDGSVEAISHLIAPLGKIPTRFGTYFAPGNHEHYAGFEQWIARLPRLGIAPLLNAHTVIGDAGDSPETTLVLAGQDDFAGRPNLTAALRGVHADQATVLLAHQPKAIFTAEKANVGLVLSGHTHGGQIFPLGAMVRLQQPYLAGLHKRGDSQIYVSRGTGFWGPPMRIAAPAEITKIVLTP